jgi:hypothetical protein
MEHLLNDRSKEPIKTYLLALLSRDPRRTAHWLIQREDFSEKTTGGFTEILDEFEHKLSTDLLRETAPLSS